MIAHHIRQQEIDCEIKQEVMHVINDKTIYKLSLPNIFSLCRRFIFYINRTPLIYRLNKFNQAMSFGFRTLLKLLHKREKNDRQ